YRCSKWFLPRKMSSSSFLDFRSSESGLGAADKSVSATSRREGRRMTKQLKLRLLGTAQRLLPGWGRCRGLRRWSLRLRRHEFLQRAGREFLIHRRKSRFQQRIELTL